MNRAELSELAEADLADLWVSIATDDIDGADRFLEGVHALAQKLAEQPLMGVARPEFGENVRSFPYREYLLIYRPQANGVGIARVVRGARDLKQIDVPQESAALYENQILVSDQRSWLDPEQSVELEWSNTRPAIARTLIRSNTSTNTSTDVDARSG